MLAFKVRNGSDAAVDTRRRTYRQDPVGGGHSHRINAHSEGQADPENGVAAVPRLVAEAIGRMCIRLKTIGHDRGWCADCSRAAESGVAPVTIAAGSLKSDRTFEMDADGLWGGQKGDCPGHRGRGL